MCRNAPTQVLGGPLPAKLEFASFADRNNKHKNMAINDVPGRVLDYLGYKNKRSAAEWAERLWRQHLEGSPQDFRPHEDRQRYLDLASRVEQSRSLAHRLHTRRSGHPRAVAPSLAADTG